MTTVYALDQSYTGGFQYYTADGLRSAYYPTTLYNNGNQAGLFDFLYDPQENRT